MLDKFQIDHVDLLHIDTEGYDWVVLSQFNLERYRPTVILFEYKHLDETDLNRAVAHVSDAIRVLLKNCGLRKNMGEKAIELMISKFDNKNLVKKLCGYYKACLSE